MSPILIIANALSFIGNLLFTLSSILKSKKKILLFQSTNHVLAIISEFMTSAYSGMVQEFSSLARNIVLLFVKKEKKILKLIITLLFVIAAVVAGVLINIFLSGNVWYGYLPVCGTIIYSTGVILAFMIKCSEVQAEFMIKIALLLNSIVWGAYGFFVKLYPIMIFNIITIVLCIISIIRISIIYKQIKREKMESQS